MQSNTIQLTIPMLLMSWFENVSESWSRTKTGQGRSPYDFEDDDEDDCEDLDEDFDDLDGEDF